jgi:hypothetical protein
MGTDANVFEVGGGLRIVPRVGGGFRTDGLWGASLTADEDSIRLHAFYAGTLVVTRRNLTAIRPWRSILSRGLEFDVSDEDELWIFRTYSGEWILSELAALGWKF